MLSNLYSNDIKAFHSLHTAYQNLVVFIGLPVAIGCMLLSNDIILLLFGQDYEGSGDIMKILVWLVPLSLLRLNYGRTLLSANFQRFNSIALGSGAFVTIMLCIFLIPRHAGLGAAWALVGGEAITLLMMKWVSSLKLGTAKLLNNYSLKILIASVLVGIILLKLHFHVLINIVLGVVFYGILAFILGIISREKIMKVLRE
jgi:O-antigen/teichoic acid export membrane protein